MSVEKPELLSRAANIFEQNEFAPNSPGVLNASGKPQMCAALALAAAIVESESGNPQSGVDFAIKVLSKNSKEASRRRILAVIGPYFRGRSGHQTMIFNDEQDPTRRKSAVLRFFRHWALHRSDKIEHE